MIDSLGDSSVYVEKYSSQTITINSTKNQNGIIEVDDNGNDMIGIYDIGAVDLGNLTTYTYTDKLLIYNDQVDKWGLYSQGEEIRETINWVNGSKYYIKAKYISSDTFSGKTFTIDTAGKNIFKVYVNGREVSTYTRTDSQITVLGIDAMFVDVNINEMTVVVYDSNQTLSDDIVITYQGVSVIFDFEEFIKTGYFDNKPLVREITIFENLTDNHEKEMSIIKNGFRKRGVDVNLGDLFNLEIQTKTGKDFVNYLSFLRKDVHRTIIVNPYNENIIIYNNQKIINGTSKNYDKDGNVTRVQATTDNKITVYTEVERAYGEGEYGLHVYGTKYAIHNTSREMI